MSKKQRLTPEQNEIRLRGLRILARMIALAHLDFRGERLRRRRTAMDADGPDVPDRGDAPHRDGKHVG